MSTRLPGFKGEYLWEFDIAERHLLALAEAFPADKYAWRPSETARSISEVLVHLAAGSRALLVLVGFDAAPELYGEVKGEGVARIMAIVAANEALEKSLTEKTAVAAFLGESLQALRSRFAEASDEELNRREVFFGEDSTVRRVYLRALCHMHEHTGQLTAYARALGLPAPWRAQDDAARREIEKKVAASTS